MTEPFVLDLDALADGDTIDSLGKAIKDALAEEGKGRWMRLSASWLGGQAVDAIDDALANFDLLDAIAGAWAGVREIADRGDTDKYRQVRTSRLRLGKHDLDIDLHPHLMVTVGGWTSPPIELSLTLTAAIEAVELRIKQGFITAIGGGVCKLSIELKRGETGLMPKRSLHKFDLPGDYRFTAPGIDIRPQHLRPRPEPPTA
ncbi:hypothetical protein [Sphingomonas sp.]|jgi:hypothetical protein|uniref:hypothetical protein n=1 Tax=Sphingomonas sp. TaxID=28214 RepID=UPI002E369CB4|nr:hypothetical protein [Sphingomonas sp.]HEX4695545.1 hypothetical protein [Sphingomonas sp.]